MRETANKKFFSSVRCLRLSSLWKQAMGRWCEGALARAPHSRTSYYIPIDSSEMSSTYYFCSHNFNLTPSTRHAAPKNKKKNEKTLSSLIGRRNIMPCMRNSDGDDCCRFERIHWGASTMSDRCHPCTLICFKINLCADSISIRIVRRNSFESFPETNKNWIRGTISMKKLSILFPSLSLVRACLLVLSSCSAVVFNWIVP